MKKRKQDPFLLFILFWLTLTFFYLNCGKGFKVNNFNFSSTSNITHGNMTNFGPGKQVSGCFESHSEEYAGCVFFKNPTFQVGKILNPPIAVNAVDFGNSKAMPVGLNNLDQYANYAVKTPLDGLDNDDFIFEKLVYGKDAYTYSVPEIISSQGQYRFSTKGSSFLNFVEFTAYYWLNSFNLKINNQSGAPAFASGTKILIVPHFYFFQISKDSPYILFNNAAWVGKEYNVIAFGLSESKGKDSSGNDLYTPAVLSGDIIAHELGHAQFEYGANLPKGLTTNDSQCGNGNKGICSKNVNGSLYAIHEGIADVYAYLMFGDTAYGQDFDNNMDGMFNCKSPRSMKAIKDQKLKAQSFYDECIETYNLPGEVHAMGSIYSTIWYGIIESARATNNTNYKDAISLFYEHQKYISESDTILTAKQAIIDVDQDLFEGKFANSINSEYKSMGY